MGKILAQDFRVKPAPGFMDEFRRIEAERKANRLKAVSAKAQQDFAEVRKRIAANDPAPVSAWDGRVITWSEVIARVAFAFSVTTADILGPSRLSLHVRARRTAMAALSARGNSLAQIGRWMNRDHTTVMYAVRKFEYAARANEKHIVAGLSQ